MADPGTTDPRRAAVTLELRLPRLVREMEEVVRRDPEWLSPSVDLAHYYLIEGKTALAAGLYREMLRSHPTDVDVMVMLGYLELRTGDLAGAEETCRRAMSQALPPAAAMINLGAIRFHQRRDDEARELWERALKKEPGQPIALANLDRLRTDPSHRDIDICFLARTVLDPGLSNLVSALALYGSDLSDADRVRMFEEAAQFYPDALEPQHTLAQIYLHDGPLQDKERALRHARRAVAIARNSETQTDLPETLLTLGRALLANGKPEEARRALEEGKSRAPAQMLPEFDELLRIPEAPAK
jgi:tetratricopeptide (TPR) repeat protein